MTRATPADNSPLKDSFHCGRRGDEFQSSSVFEGSTRDSSRRLPLFRRAAKRARAGFTLAEVLAALAFMAVVIPVAVQGLRVASLAGQVGQRKAVAARIAERVLNELSVTGQLQASGQSGVAQEGALSYRWNVRTEAWPVDAMRLVTVQVTFPAQGQEYDVRLSTLMNN